MANKFISFLAHFGKDIEHGIEKAAPFIASAGAAIVSIASPQLATAFRLVAGVVIQTEQKFAAIGKQDGTGAQKLSEASSIVGDVVSQLLEASGNASSEADVQKYISAIVAFLNGIPTGAPSA